MAETRDMGCGFMASFFQRKGFKQTNVVLLQDVPRKNNQLATKSANKPRPPQNPTTRPPSNYARKSTSQLGITLSDQMKVGSEGTPRRASTGNVVLLGHLKQKSECLKSDHDRKIASTLNALKNHNHQLGNILQGPRVSQPSHPDVVKSLGNEKYKQGRYEEALALYDRAISIDPNRACYYGNKAAALIGLGRLVEAVFQCREAVRIDSSYHNAHFRLAKLYIRLGVAEKAVYHYQCSGRKACPEDVALAQDLKSCLDRCVEARSNGDWRKMVDESQTASCLGADSALQIHATKAEALMKLHRHEDAYFVIQNAPHFSINLYAEFLGPTATSVILQVRALVYMANGRFEDAVRDAGNSVRLDSRDSVKLAAERVKSVATARVSGNQLFKGSRYSEGLIAYNAGLEIDPRNSVLLCNRAACRFKLGQYEKAVEDCTVALLVRPSYSKARLRRANCYAQLEKWEAAIEDYELLMRETPGDEEVRGALLESKIHLNKMQNGHMITADTDTISNLSSVSSDKDFTYLTATPGLSVVLFCSKTRSKKTFQLLEDVCVKFPSVNFLKVDIEERLSIAKSESVKFIPTFRIYRNGSLVDEIGDSFDKLESCIKSYCCT